MFAAGPFVVLSRSVREVTAKRTVQAAREHTKFRREFMKDLATEIRETDYRIAVANSSEAHHHLSYTGPHVINRKIIAQPDETVKAFLFDDPPTLRLTAPHLAQPRSKARRPFRRSSSKPQNDDLPSLLSVASDSIDDPLTRSGTASSLGAIDSEERFVSSPIPLSDLDDTHSAVAPMKMPSPQKQDEANLLSEVTPPTISSFDDEEDFPGADPDPPAEDIAEPIVTRPADVTPREAMPVLHSSSSEPARPGEENGTATEEEEEDGIDAILDQLNAEVEVEEEEEGAVDHVDKQAIEVSSSGPRVEEEESADESDQVTPDGLGYGPDGSAELGLEASAAGLPDLATFCETARSQGFTWLFLRNLPSHAGLGASTTSGVKVRSAEPPDFGRYSVDRLAFNLLAQRKPAEVEQYLARSGQSELRRLVHMASLYSGSEAVTAALLLPGLRVLSQDDPYFSQLVKLLNRQTIRLGTFSMPSVTHQEGRMVVWKYSGETGILVCVQCSDGAVSASIQCPDVPDGPDEVDIYEWIEPTTYKRNRNALKADGLCVILRRPFQIQVFEY
jgi:hypothetical protein